MAGNVDPIDRLLSLAEAQGGLKLWSLIVTIMGDLSHRRGARDDAPEISGLALAEIIERMGLQPQAMRVALHRLKSDGWIESRRKGRVSFHRLSDRGQAETNSVAGLIYGREIPDPGQLWMRLQPEPGQELPPCRASLMLGRDAHVVAGPTAGHDPSGLCLPFRPETRPIWFAALLADAARHEAFAQLAQEVSELAERDVPTEERERVALRAILLHVWRVSVLRANEIALRLSLPDEPPAQCRRLVLDQLDRIGTQTPG